MKIAIFDFDGTLFQKQSIPFLMDYYKRENYPKGPYIRFLLKLLGCMVKYKNPLVKDYGKEVFRREVALRFIQVFNGQPKASMDMFFKDVSEEIIEALSKDVVAEVQRCEVEGYHTVLLSGCYDDLLNYIAEAIGVDTVIGTPIDETMYADGNMHIEVLDIATGPRKVEKLKEAFKDKQVKWQESTSYGDSSYDRYILELVGNPVAVRPDDILREVAQVQGWRIIE